MGNLGVFAASTYCMCVGGRGGNLILARALFYPTIAKRKKHQATTGRNPRWPRFWILITDFSVSILVFSCNLAFFLRWTKIKLARGILTNGYSTGHIYSPPGIPAILQLWCKTTLLFWHRWNPLCFLLDPDWLMLRGQGPFGPSYYLHRSCCSVLEWLVRMKCRVFPPYFPANPHDGSWTRFIFILILLVCSE